MGLGHNLATVWKEVALKAAQARLGAFGGSESVGSLKRLSLTNWELIDIGISQR